MAYHKYYPYKGKWTLQRLIKESIQASGGEIPVEALLDYLKKKGYHKESVRRSLEPLDVEVVDGVARLKG